MVESREPFHEPGEGRLERHRVATVGWPRGAELDAGVGRRPGRAVEHRADPPPVGAVFLPEVTKSSSKRVPTAVDRDDGVVRDDVVDGVLDGVEVRGEADLRWRRIAFGRIED